jgi:hypothetical protein
MLFENPYVQVLVIIGGLFIFLILAFWLLSKTQSSLPQSPAATEEFINKYKDLIKSLLKPGEQILELVLGAQEKASTTNTLLSLVELDIFYAMPYSILALTDSRLLIAKTPRYSFVIGGTAKEVTSIDLMDIKGIRIDDKGPMYVTLEVESSGGLYAVNIYKGPWKVFAENLARRFPAEIA